MLSTTTAAEITQNYMNITLDLCALKHEDFVITDGGKMFYTLTHIHRIITLSRRFIVNAK